MGRNFTTTDTDTNSEYGFIQCEEIKVNQKSNGRYFVIDNFYEDPDAVREFALYQTYFEGEGAVGYRTRKQFLFDGMKEKFEEIIREKIPDHTPNGHGWKDVGINGRFQSCKAGTPMVYHCDAQKWAGVLFLTPDAPPQSGTSFYRHKKTKVYHNSQINWEAGQGMEVFNQHTFLDPTPYEKMDTVGNAYNRLVIFDGGLIHSGNDYFGWDFQSSRLFQIFFFSE